MSPESLVGTWKDPKSRFATSASHPAGAIRIDTAPTVGRRIRLLSWPAANSDGDFSTVTYTTITYSPTPGFTDPPTGRL